MSDDYLGKVFCQDVSSFFYFIPDSSINLVVTSPPYSEKRVNVYGGIKEEEYSQWLLGVSKEVMRVLKPSGSFVLNIKEGIVKGKKQIYVLEYLLEMAKLGWWAETFIWVKTNPFPTGNKRRLKDGFEYCYQFTKSNEYKFFPKNCLVPANPKWLKDNLKRKNKGEHFVKNNSGMNMSIRTVDSMVRPSNVITLSTNSTNTDHPATFPVGLPKFFISLMTEEGDIVCDPFVGSGTTIQACLESNRKWVANDREQAYVDMTLERIKKFEKKT